MTFVSSQGLGLPATAVEQLKTLQDLQHEKALIQQVFQLYFPNYIPDDSKPNSTKTGPRTDIGVPDNSIPKYAFNPETGRPTLTVPTLVTNPDTGKTTIVNLVFTNTPPIFRVTDAADVQATPTTNLGPHSFKLGDHVKIIDPDIGIAVFYDEAVPYVTNTGLIIQTVGPASISTNTSYLLNPNLITLDRSTGVVTYDPEAFRFLGEGETAVYKFTFTSASGQDSATQHLVFTVTGHNDAPVFAVNDTPLAFSETAAQTGQSSAHLIVPVHLNFTDEDYSDVASSFTLSKSVTTNVTGTHATTPDLSKLPDSNTLKSYLKIVADGTDTDLGVSRTSLSDAGQVTAKFSAPDKVFDFLAAGEQIQLVYTIVVTDAHGESDTQTVTITVTGTNDVPVLMSDSSAHVLKETTSASLDAGISTLKTSGTLDFTDVDLNDLHTATSPATAASVTWEKPSGQGSHFSAGTVPGATLAALAAALTTTLLADSAHGATGQVGWTFKLPDGLADFLADGETLTVTYNVAVDDGHTGNGISTQPVTIVITGTNDGPQAVADINQGAAVVESGNNTDGSTFAGNASATGNVLANDIDVDINDTHCVVGVGAGAVTGPLSNGAGTICGKYGTLSLNADGTWTYTLDNDNPLTNALAQGAHADDIFSYTVSDNHGATSTTTLTVAVTGSNNSPQANAAPAAVTDVNSGPAIVEAGVDGCGVDHATGNVLANDFDIDTGDTKTVQGVAAGTVPGPFSGHVGTVVFGTYGWVTIAADGSWSYLLDNGSPATQALAKGAHVSDVFTYTMHDAAGATSSATLTIDVTGTNDAPIITSSVENSSGSVTEDDMTLKAVGQLTASDVDHDATQAWSVVGLNTGKYGSLAVDASTGQWTYTLANGTNGVAGPVQSLAAGEHYDEAFTVRVVDDHGASAEQVVTVTVHGTDDAPVVTVTNPAAVSEGDIATHSPVTVTIADHVAIADVDATDAHIPHVANILAFGSPTGPAPSNGTLSDLFTIDATHGTVIYDRAAFDYLAAGQQVTATFTFDVSSGSDTLHQSITVTIDGVNDAPVIDTNNLHLSTSHGHTTISGLSISDPDSDHFTIDTTTNHGHVSLADGTYDLAAINSALQSGVNYTPYGHSSVGKVAFTVTDDHSATDTVNFIFRQNDFGPVTLTGTAQNDVLIGGAGRDYFVFSSNSGHDVITNFAAGHDKIVLNGMTSVPSGNWFDAMGSRAVALLSQQGADTLIHLDGTDNILLKNVNLASLHANDFIIPHV